MNAPTNHLRVEERAYSAVPAKLDVFVNTTDTMSRVIELPPSLKSRTCQVVLDAGAMRSAGLKKKQSSRRSIQVSGSETAWRAGMI